MKKRVLSVFLFLCFIGNAQDIQQSPLVFQLSAKQNIFSLDAIIPLYLSFKNTSNKTVTLILPGREKTGQAILRLSYYAIHNDVYTEVFREALLLGSDSVEKVGEWIRNLRPGDSLQFPLLLNDAENEGLESASYHRLPRLPEGQYALRILYNPLKRPMAPYFYTIQESQDTTAPDAHKLNIPKEGIASDLFLFELRKNTEVRNMQRSETDERCSLKCRMCKAIEAKHWGTVERIIASQAAKEVKSKWTPHWTEPHRAVFWIYPGPEAILSSLPTYTYRKLIFYSEGEYHYADLSWQLGKILRFNTRIKRGIDFLFASDINIPTSDLEYIQLRSFKLNK